MTDERVKQITEFAAQFRVAPGTKVRLARDFDPGFTVPSLHVRGVDLLQQGVEMLADYQARLAAENRHGVLVVLQGIDAAGKDGTIRHVMSGVNPQGVHVHSFKVPSDEELDHDYLWRYAQRLPGRGEIAIFNRSHYEEVLVVRVHPEILQRQRLPAQPGTGVTGPTGTTGTTGKTGKFWERRYREINDWERYLHDNGLRIVKLFLNLSKEEQRRRFLRRIDRSAKNWKFSAADVRERRYWDDYQHAFSEMLSHTSTPWAPWYVIPADHKWFTRVGAATAILNALIDIDPQYPVVDDAARRDLLAAKAELEAEAPPGAARDSSKSPSRPGLGSCRR